MRLVSVKEDLVGPQRTESVQFLWGGGICAAYCSSLNIANKTAIVSLGRGHHSTAQRGRQCDNLRFSPLRGSIGLRQVPFGTCPCCKLRSPNASLSIVLLAGAGLLLRSFWRVLEVRPGFNPKHLTTVQIWFPGFFPETSPSAPSSVWTRRAPHFLHGQDPSTRTAGVCACSQARGTVSISGNVNSAHELGGSELLQCSIQGRA